MRKPYFDLVDPKPNFPEMEKRLLDGWYKKGIVKKYLSKNNSSKKNFSFLDGPITANGPMGVHHAWGRTYKDLWQRFKNMQGYRQRFQNGFDCQGLWVEVEVEKELGFKNKKDIEVFGVDKFVQLCKDRVKKYSGIQTEQSKRLGYFMDWDNSYYTLSDDNNYMIWHFLKTCHEHGWLYKGNDSVPWCPRCETAISQHEMLTEDYSQTTHESIYITFPVVGKKDEYLLVWTTTPWTIPANIAIAVDEKLDYILVQLPSGKKYWLAKESLKRVLADEEYKVIKEFKGKQFVGLKYKGAFDHLPAVAEAAKSEKFHTVIMTDDLILPISVTEGTGLVHTAVSAGSEDFKLGAKLGLPMIPVIADNADYLPGLGFLSGKNAKENPRLILDYMEEEGFAFKIENYTHRYPACWRCKTELVWKVTDEWYIAMDSSNLTLRERMKRVAKKINWIPEFGLGRELDWLSNMHDWLISKKNRYWGLALPIWECGECGNFEVIGSLEELRERVVEGWDEFAGKSPHKPQIDKVKIKCCKCEQVISRVEPVGNPWLDAGIVAFSTISADNQSRPLYLIDRKAWEDWYPADFITESFPGQFKNWFYALIAMSTALEDREPFKTVFGYATLLAEDGRPMHKSWGNAIEFNEGADKIGVDVMRWMYVRQNPEQNLLFGYRVADEVRRRFHLKLWNVYNFFITYANLDGWSPSAKAMGDKKPKISVLDKWILARLDQTVKEITEKLEDYDAYNASAGIEAFVDDFSLWYIRRSRSRVGPAAEDEKDKNAFYDTCCLSLVTLSKLLAPFTPFLAEVIYKNLTKEESVHLASWPSAKILSDEDTEILSDMQLIREIAEKAHARRKAENISLKQPLLTLKTKYEKLSPDLEHLLCEEINVKSIVWGAKIKDDIVLNIRIAPELEEEAKARDLIRRIQEERKNLGLTLADEIIVGSPWLPKHKKLLEWIKKKTVAKDLEHSDKFEVKRA